MAKAPRFAACAVAVILLVLPAAARAQRTLHWDRIDVTAHLDAEGTLNVTESQTLVFNGDWNGGERRFNIRPRQQLHLVRLERVDGGSRTPMVRDSLLDDVDEYAFTDDTTLRWRSRLPGDPPFANRTITYVLVYQLSNILLKNESTYTLDHDFLFPDRDAVISRASVALTFDPEWEPQASVRTGYTAEQLPPGQGLVLTVPLRYTGAGSPASRDTRLPPAMVNALWSLLVLPVAVIAWTFARERSYGRFAPLHTQIDEAWIRDNIVKHPAEVVAAAWDDQIESAEVVALIARLVAERKLVRELKGKKSMSLRLSVDRDKLDGYERALVDALFFKGRLRTSTQLVQQHYRKTGFNPSDVIRAGLKSRAAAALPSGRMPWTVPLLGTAAYVGGAFLVAREWQSGRISTEVAALFALGVLPLLMFARWEGLRVRANIQWGAQRALVSLIPAAIAIVAAALYLWRFANNNEFEVSDGYVAGIVLLAMSVLFTAVGALKSKQHRAVLAFRKTLASGREFFITELAKDRPALRDEWFPWVLAFGLGKEMDAWSATRADRSSPTSSSRSSSSDSFASGGAASSAGTWTGFAGGHSGGAGASASWGSAMAAFAAPIAPPSSSSSGGGSGSSSSSSSSGGSSGGGGGGGW